MSALTDLFTTMANKIRSKTGTATTYTPAQMASTGIDDVYAAGAASVPAPTNITPSDATPAAMSANTNYHATTNGYAVESVRNCTPSNSSPSGLTGGKVYKMSNNGVAISSYDAMYPSSTPQTFISGNFYKATGGGYVVKSVIDYSSPTYVKQGNMSANASLSQATSSRAKLVIAYRVRYGDNNGYSNLMIWDDVNQNGYSLQYTSSGYVYNTVDNTQDTIVVTDSNVTYNNKASSTHRGHVAIWC